MRVRFQWWLLGIALMATSLASSSQYPPARSTASPKGSAFLTVTPSVIGFPAYAKPGVEVDTTIQLSNAGDETLVFGSIVTFEDSCKGPGCMSGWLGYTGITGTATIPAAGNTNMTLQLNKAGVISDVSAPKHLWGRIVFTYGPPNDQTLTLSISFTIADSIAIVKFDTVATVTNIQLIVGSNGDAGHNSLGRVNMNFNPPVECDTGSNSRGNADIYLGDASPVILRKVGSDPARLSYSMYGHDYTSPDGFKPLANGNPPAFTAIPAWQQYFSGTFTTVDSLLRVEKTWYAPTNKLAAGSFIFEKLRIWPTVPQAVVGNLAIGAAYDWDIPSDSFGNFNSGGYDASRRLVWQRGFESADYVTDCWNNGLRYAGSALIGTDNWDYLYACPSQFDTLYAGYTARNDSLVYPAGGFVPDQLWNNMQTKGYANLEGSGTWADLHTVLVFRNAPGTGWSFPAQARDTLTVYTVMAVVRYAESPEAGLDSLKATIDRARCWARYWVIGCVGDCCQERTGNVNMLGIVDLADLSALVSYLTGGGFVPPCPKIANVNDDGIIDLADLSALVSYLTGGGFVLPLCESKCRPMW